LSEPLVSFKLELWDVVLPKATFAWKEKKRRRSLEIRWNQFNTVEKIVRPTKQEYFLKSRSTKHIVTI
jgi:hypothetical protein